MNAYSSRSMASFRAALVCVLPLVIAGCGEAEPQTTAVSEVTVSVTKVGSGTVTSSPAGIDCGATCSGSASVGATVTLSAVAASGFTFSGWSGDASSCAGMTSCALVVSAARSVTATFQAQAAQYQLTTAVGGGGTVTSAPSGINCGSDCVQSYSAGTGVTLTATAAAGSVFSGWTGVGITCPGTGTCQVTMNAAASVIATFTAVTPGTPALTVSVSGSGTVSSSPGGISCPGDCAESYPSGTSVVLTASPASGFTFGGWNGGGCSGTSTCTVALNVAATVNAAFTSTTPTTRLLTVSVSGSGMVSSNPAGVSCPADCTESYASGTSVVLTASPASGFTFSGWSGGGCSGTATCTVALNAATTVNATFTASTSTARLLTVSVSGSGTVSSNPGGISCPADCTETYASGSSVVLTASAASGFTFSGWSGGGCGGTSTCPVVLSAATTVSAVFASVSGGLTYYVSPSGSDSNNGTSLATPFKTVSTAVSRVNAGDIIEVRAGTYNENVVIRRPGSASAWITLRGYSGERPIIRGTGAGPSIYFYADACDEDNIGSGSGNTDCLAMYWLIQGIEVRGSASGGGDGNAIKIDTPKVKLQNNRLCCAVADIVKLVRTSNDVEILGNELWQDSAITTPSSNAQAVDIVGADRSIVFGNYVHDVPDIGIYAKGNARNTVFDSNTLVNIGSNALMLGQSTDADRLADGVYESYDGIIRNNVVVNAAWACLATSSSSNVRIYNNSCYNTGTTTHGSILLSNESEVGTPGQGILIVNNILYGSSSHPILRITSNAITSYSSLTLDNNIYYVSGGSPTFSSSDSFSTPISFAQWLIQYTSLTTHTDHSRVVDPQYSATTGSTPLTLQPTSPAINTGQANSISTSDIRGVTRPQGTAIDVGAYEY